MGSRRWLDTDNVLKMGGGLVMMAIPAWAWFGGGFITRGLWTLGILGLFVFVWGLASIGDRKSEWD